jgi:hypothetical protein
MSVVATPVSVPAQPPVGRQQWTSAIAKETTRIAVARLLFRLFRGSSVLGRAGCPSVSGLLASGLVQSDGCSRPGSRLGWTSAIRRTTASPASTGGNRSARCEGCAHPDDQGRRQAASTPRKRTARAHGAPTCIRRPPPREARPESEDRTRGRLGRPRSRDVGHQRTQDRAGAGHKERTQSADRLSGICGDVTTIAGSLAGLATQIAQDRARILPRPPEHCIRPPDSWRLNGITLPADQRKTR